MDEAVCQYSVGVPEREERNIKQTGREGDKLRNMQRKTERVIG